ncbi:MAG TPA: hypothetical protein ENJ65_03560, partial [Candidatus Tenderia electrophaga]|nr:hypothetical protein [Candidatus Tenderia electrophaga]
MLNHKKLPVVISLAAVMRLGLMLSLLLPMLAMAAQQPAGFVLMAKGDVFAVQPDQQQRLLKRKSPFYSGESLKTGQNAKAQLRFRDGSLISMRADTEIRIDEFRFQGADKADDKNIFTLVSGGFRTITGKIGKKNPRNYQMKSAVASIGVRGTTYEVVIDDGLNVAAWQGTIVVENEMGHITLGAEGVFNFAHIASPVIEPKGLMNPPAVIAAPAPVKAEVADKKDGPKAPPQRRSTPEQGAALESAPASVVGQRIEPNAEPKVEPGFDPGFEPQAEQVFVANVELNTEQGLEPSLDPEFDPVTDGRIDSVIQAADDSGVDAEPAVLVDSRVSSLELDRLAMAVVTGEGVEGMFAGGKAGLDADGKLHIADNGLSPAEAGFDSAPFVRVLTQGAAPTLLSESMLIDANHRLEWGIWQATAAAPAQLQTDAADSGVYTAINRPVYWGTATVTSAEAMSAQTGVASYKNVLGFIGSGNSGAIDDMYVNLALNFDTAAVEGLASIYTPAESWYLSLSGAIDGPVLNISSVSGEVNGNAVQGEFNSLFTGDAAQAVVSSFDFESVLEPALHVEGLVVVDNAAGPDLRLKNINLDRLGMYQYVDVVAGVEGFVGLAGNDASNNLFFATNGLEPGQTGFLTAPVTSLLSQGGALETALFADTVYPVSWGIWDGTAQPAVMAISADDPRLTEDVSRRVRWLTLEPSSATAIAAKTGSVAYDNVIAFDAAGSGGVVQELLINLGVNFDTGNVVGDVDLQTPDNGLWQAAFSGVIAGPGFSADSVSGFYNSDLAINGQFAAAFTGANADAMAGMFSFERVD